MKTLSIFLLIFFISVNGLEQNCNGTIYNKICHDVKVLREGIRKPFSLALVHTTSNLYFSYNRHLEDNTETARLNLNTHRVDTIENVPNAKANTVDRKTGDVYIGGCPGIYKLRGHQHDHKPQFHTANESCIQSLFFYNFRLYYITYPSMNVYINGINRRDKKFNDLVDTTALNFVIDKHNVMYYNNDSGLYFQKFGTKTNKAILIPSDHTKIKCLTVDNKGDIFVCMDDGIYKFFRKSYDLAKILDIEQPLGLTFDIYNNVIYSNESVIARLKPRKERIVKTDIETGRHNNNVVYSSVKPSNLDAGRENNSQAPNIAQVSEISETSTVTVEVKTVQTEVTPTRDPFQIHTYWDHWDDTQETTSIKYETKSEAKKKKDNRYWAEMLEPVTEKDKLEYLNENLNSIAQIEDHGKHRHWVPIKETAEYETTTDYETKNETYMKEKNRYWARLLQARDEVAPINDNFDKNKIQNKDLDTLNKAQYAKDIRKQINDMTDYEPLFENPENTDTNLVDNGLTKSFHNTESKDDDRNWDSEFEPLFKKYETVTDETVAELDIVPLELTGIYH